MSPIILYKCYTFGAMKNEADVIRFGEHLRALRDAKGMSQQELADLSDIDKKTVQRIELGRTNPTLDVLISLSNVLGLKLRELCDF